MTDLFEKSIETLELPRVLDLLADQAVTQEGKERARRLRPETDLEEVAQRLKETTAAVDRMVLRGSPSFSGVKPVAGSLQRADMGGSLNTRELLDIAAVLAAARSAKDYGESEEEKKTPIDVLFRALKPNRFLEDKITGRLRQPGTGLHPPAHAGHREQGAGHFAAHPLLLPVQVPPGEHHHPALRPVRGAGEVGV